MSSRVYASPGPRPVCSGRARIAGSLAWGLALIVVFLPLAVRRYSRGA
ncbi:hypothetical protein [Streptomyces sp. NPDC091383]